MDIEHQILFEIASKTIFKELIVYRQHRQWFVDHQRQRILQQIRNTVVGDNIPNAQLMQAYDLYTQEVWIKSDINKLIANQLPFHKTDKQVAAYMHKDYPMNVFLRPIWLKYYLLQSIVLVCIVRYDFLKGRNDIPRQISNILYPIYKNVFPVERYIFFHAVNNICNGNERNLLNTIFSEQMVQSINQLLQDWNQLDLDQVNVENEAVQLSHQLCALFNPNFQNLFRKTQTNVQAFVRRSGLYGFGNQVINNGQVNLIRDFIFYNPPRFINLIQHNDGQNGGQDQQQVQIQEQGQNDVLQLINGNNNIQLLLPNQNVNVDIFDLDEEQGGFQPFRGDGDGFVNHRFINDDIDPIVFEANFGDDDFENPDINIDLIGDFELDFLDDFGMM